MSQVPQSCPPCRKCISIRHPTPLHSVSQSYLPPPVPAYTMTALSNANGAPSGATAAAFLLLLQSSPPGPPATQEVLPKLRISSPLLHPSLTLLVLSWPPGVAYHTCVSLQASLHRSPSSQSSSGLPAASGSFAHEFPQLNFPSPTSTLEGFLKIPI